jgi:hypothetical protein
MDDQKNARFLEADFSGARFHDRWITGPVLRDAKPFHPLGMPNPPLDEVPAGVFDLEAKPTFDEVLAVRRDRMDRVEQHVTGIDADGLSRQVPSPNGGTTSTPTAISRSWNALSRLTTEARTPRDQGRATGANRLATKTGG